MGSLVAKQNMTNHQKNYITLYTFEEKINKNGNIRKF